MKNRFSCGGKNVYSEVVNAWNSVGYVGLCLVVVNGVAGCRSSESSKPNTRTNAGVTTAEATPEATSEEEVPVKTRQGSGKPAHGRPIQIVAGWNHICLRTDSDDVYCWGMNAGGEVGDGTINHSSPFDNVRRTPFHLGKITNLKTMALGHMLSLAIAGEGVIWVWGGTTHLEPLIDGKYKSHLVPERLNVAVRLQSLSTSGAHACGIDAKNQLFCWGTNDYGELGDGTDTARPVPQRVELPEPATYVSVSGNHSCAIVKSGAVYCWGLDPRGRPLEPVDNPILSFPSIRPSTWAMREFYRRRLRIGRRIRIIRGRKCMRTKSPSVSRDWKIRFRLLWVKRNRFCLMLALWGAIPSCAAGAPMIADNSPTARMWTDRRRCRSKTSRTRHPSTRQVHARASFAKTNRFGAGDFDMGSIRFRPFH